MNRGDKKNIIVFKCHQLRMQLHYLNSGLTILVLSEHCMLSAFREPSFPTHFSILSWESHEYDILRRWDTLSMTCRWLDWTLKVDLVSAGRKAALIINSIKQSIFNSIWLEIWEAGEGVSSSKIIHIWMAMCMQCSQVIPSKYFVFDEVNACMYLCSILY